MYESISKHLGERPANVLPSVRDPQTKLGAALRTHWLRLRKAFVNVQTNIRRSIKCLRTPSQSLICHKQMLNVSARDDASTTELGRYPEVQGRVTCFGDPILHSVRRNSRGCRWGEISHTPYAHPRHRHGCNVGET